MTPTQDWELTTASDYKDDGTNILLDANENAYGPGLDLNGESALTSSIDVDLLGLHRYPDPYAIVNRIVYNIWANPYVIKSPSRTEAGIVRPSQYTHAHHQDPYT